MSVWQFVTESPTVVVLDIDDGTNFEVRRGMKVGKAPVEHSWLQNAEDGATITKAVRGITEMFIPVTILKQPGDDWADMFARYETLADELDKDRNIMRFTPPGTSMEFFADTYRAVIPSLFDHDVELPPISTLTKPKYPILELIINRDPQLRGAGAYV